MRTRDVLAAQVRDQVAEAIDVHHLARIALRLAPLDRDDALDFGPRVGRRRAADQAGRGRRKHVAPLERRAGRTAPEGRIFNPVGGQIERRRQAQNAVVGPDQDVVLGLDHDRITRAAHARIHHRHVHGAARKRGRGQRQQKCARDDVLWPHVMGNVDDLRLRCNAQDHALHLGHVRVGGAEVRGQRDDHPSIISPARLTRKRGRPYG